MAAKMCGKSPVLLYWTDCNEFVVLTRGMLFGVGALEYPAEFSSHAGKRGQVQCRLCLEVHINQYATPLPGGQYPWWHHQKFENKFSRIKNFFSAALFLFLGVRDIVHN
jgi:hypothetical protein